ncbi:MAG: Ig-like domain-containing protein [Candidatus Diapherotrites archaeon]
MNAKIVLVLIVAVALIQAASAAVIFQDNFNGSPYWDSQMGTRAPNWDYSPDWSAYGLPDAQIFGSSCGRMNSGCFQVNYEDRGEPSGHLNKDFPGNSELYFRWYVKFDNRWIWQNLTFYKMARFYWNYQNDPGTNYVTIPDWAWMPPRLYTGAGAGAGTILSDPANPVYFSEFGAGKWYEIEFRLKNNDLGQNNGILQVWFNGKLRQTYNNISYVGQQQLLIDHFNIGDNTNNQALVGIAPNEWWVRHDDVKVSTTYIGPEPCPNETEITPENVGACYCGTTTPNPACSPTNTTACTGVVDSGYCNNGVWSPSGTSDTTPPTVSISSPTTGSTVSGTITVTANASDNVAVAGVQFKLDGSNLESEDLSAPYSVSWNTTTASNSLHALTAVARDASGNTATSTTVNVTVNNAASTGWVFCANEGETCSFTGTRQVRYGANQTYAYGTYTNSVSCSNSVFGDPIYGAAKQCDYNSSTTSCTENWSCTAWSTCSGGTQTRTCTDSAACGTTVNKPVETQSCSTPGAGVIFEDDFEGWNDAVPNDSSLIWSPANGSISSASNGKWCSSQQWNEYGLPDTQVIPSKGRYNSQCVEGNIESRVQPAAGVVSLLPDKTHDELYFRWYTKYDPTWSWWPNQNGQKLARMSVGPADIGCTTLNDHIIPTFAWGRMAYEIFPSVITPVYSDPEVTWYDRGAGKWILIEVYSKLNTVGQSDGVLTSWINGKKVLHKEGVVIRNSNYNFTNLTIGDNIIYTNQAGSSGVPWLPPEEKQIWWDDVKVSTSFIGPEPCKNGVEITPENVGTCYCGTGTPNPDCATNTNPPSTNPAAGEYITPNPSACTGIVDSGYCCNGSWQTTSCTPAVQCTVNVANPCTISLAGGTINSCTQQNLIYQYNATTTVNHTVNGLQASKAYDIKIENTTQGTTQNKTASTNASGMLQFGS